MAERLRVRPRERLRLGAEAPREEETAERKPREFTLKPSFLKGGGLRLPEEKPRLEPTPASGERPVEKPAQKPSEEAAPRPRETKPAQLFPESNHLVVVPTYGDRPHKLGSLLRSIYENTAKFGYDKRIKVLVVDESGGERGRRNKEILAKTEENSGGRLKIFHYSKEEREAVLEKLNEKLAGRGINVYDYMYDSKGRNPFVGARNTAMLIAARHAKPEDLVTFFDDDVQLKNLVIEPDGKLALKHTGSYFKNLDELFADRKVKVAGGEYTGDEGDAAFNSLTYGLDNLHSFFSKAASLDPSDRAREIIGPMWRGAWEAGHRHVKTFDVTAGSALHLLGNLTDQLSRGRFRFSLGFHTKGVPVESELHVGGNITMRAHALGALPFAPISNTRGEDILWTLMFNRKYGGVYYSANPVLHQKEINGRRILSDAVRDAPVHSLVEIIRELDKRHRRGGPQFTEALQSIPRETIERFTAPQQKKLERMFAFWNSRTIDLHDAMQKGWWTRKEYAEPTERIRNALKDFRRGIPEARKAAKKIFDSEQIRRDLVRYARNADRWAEVYQAAREL